MEKVTSASPAAPEAAKALHVQAVKMTDAQREALTVKNDVYIPGVATKPEQCRREQRGPNEYTCDCKPGECPVQAAKPGQQAPLEKLTRLTEEMGLYPWQQAQAGEPGVVAWVTDADVRDFGKGPGESAFCFTRHGKWNVPLITLQAYREAMEKMERRINVAAGIGEYVASVNEELIANKIAITKKYAALKAGVEALLSAKGNINPERGFADEVEAEIDAAITQMQEAMK